MIENSLRKNKKSKEEQMEAGKLAVLARKWVVAMNDRQLDDVLALYADDADHNTPAFDGGTIQGNDALRRWWEAAFQSLPSLRYELQTITAQDPDRVVIEYQRCVDDENPMMVAEVFEVDEEGLIIHSRVYRG